MVRVFVAAAAVRAGLGAIDWMSLVKSGSAIILGLILSLSVWANSQPEPGFWSADGPVRGIALATNVTYIAGGFTQLTHGVDVVDRYRLAALKSSTGALDLTWNPVTALNSNINVIHALVLSRDGSTLFLAGDFSQLAGQPRQHVAAINLGRGTLSAWNPDVDGIIRTLALSADGLILYVGGDFLHANGKPRSHLAAILTSQPSVTPWMADADGIVRTLALTRDDSTLFVGGDFSTLAGKARGHLAKLAVSSAQPSAWQAATNVRVRTIRLNPDESRLFIGGDFTQVAGLSHKHLTSVSTAEPASVTAAFVADADLSVRALAVSRDSRVVFSGGDFTLLNGTARTRLVALDAVSGVPNAWDPAISGSMINRIDAIAISADDKRLFVGGDFSQIGGSTRSGLAVFDIAPPLTTPSIAAGGYSSPQSLDLTCQDNVGATCLSIRYTLDGSDPLKPSGLTFAGPIPINQTHVTIRYSGRDVEGRVEPVVNGTYFIDTIPPESQPSLPAGQYGKLGIKNVILSCTDNLHGSGCKEIHFSSDGSEPSLNPGSLYRRPLSLPGFLADPAGDGTVTLKYFALDKTGNRETTRSAVYVLDQLPPTVTVDPLGGSYPGPVDVTLTCQDGNGSGCRDMFYTLDGTKPSDGTILDSDGNPIVTTLLYDLPIHMAHGTSLTVLATDRSGNSDSQLIAIYAFTTGRSDDRHGLAAMDYPTLIGLLMAVIWLWLGLQRQGKPPVFL